MLYDELSTIRASPSLSVNDKVKLLRNRDTSIVIKIDNKLNFKTLPNRSSL